MALIRNPIISMRSKPIQYEFKQSRRVHQGLEWDKIQTKRVKVVLCVLNSGGVLEVISHQIPKNIKLHSEVDSSIFSCYP